MSARRLNIIGAPTSAGAYAPGQEKAPAAFRRHGLMAALRETGRSIVDRGDVAAFRWRPDLMQPNAMNLAAVASACSALSERVAAAIEADEDVLVLGGDCTVELGTVAGASRSAGAIGLVYIDFDADLNAPDTSDGALDWTGVAHLLGLPGCALELSAIGARRPMIAAEQLLYFGVENITAPEARIIDERRIALISRDEARADIRSAAARAANWAQTFDSVLIHFDVDVLSFIDFPIAENVRRCDGLTLDQVACVLKRLIRLPQWRGLTITEVNPDHAPEEAAAFHRLNRAIADALS